MSKIKYRQQNEGNEVEVSIDNFTTDLDPQHVTRQEFKDETDVNWLMHRYAGQPLGNSSGTHPLYGVANFDDDLTTAYAKVREAQEAYNLLPDEVKDLYPSWHHLAREIALGDHNPAYGRELDQKISDMINPKPLPPEVAVSAAKPAVPPPESAK